MQALDRIGEVAHSAGGKQDQTLITDDDETLPFGRHMNRWSPSNIRRICFPAPLAVIALLCAAVTGAAPEPASAAGSTVVKAAAKVGWRAFLKHPSALPDEQISGMASRALRPGGIAEVGEELGRLKLSNAVLEDTYLRMVVHQDRLSRGEAESIYEALHDTVGFRTTLRKIAGANNAVSTGHLNELRIARAAVENGLEVQGIGVPFDDLIKKGTSDIDVLLTYRNTTLAVEAKDYQPGTRIPLDSFRADMDTLVQYRKLHPNEKVVPVFTTTSKPSDAAAYKLLESAARLRGVELIIGGADEQTYVMKALIQ